MNSRAKGKRGELDFCRFLSEHGYPARRGQQHAGGADSPDVICECMPDVHHEVKRTERLYLHEALDQAVRDAVTKLPVVWYRRNGYGWVAILRGEDMLSLLRESDYVVQPEDDDGHPV